MHFKKCFYVLLFFIAAVGLVGGFGYAIYDKQYFISSCILVLGFLAMPTLKQMFDYFR